MNAFCFYKKFLGLSVFLLVPLFSFAQTVSTTTQSTSSLCPVLSYNLYSGQSDRKTKGEVSKLQTFLSNYFNYDFSDLVTGFFGSKTQFLVKQFQSKNSIMATGFVGAYSRQAILNICGPNNMSANASTSASSTNVFSVSVYNPNNPQNVVGFCMDHKGQNYGEGGVVADICDTKTNDTEYNSCISSYKTINVPMYCVKGNWKTFYGSNYIYNIISQPQIIPTSPTSSNLIIRPETNDTPYCSYNNRNYIDGDVLHADCISHYRLNNEMCTDPYMTGTIAFPSYKCSAGHWFKSRYIDGSGATEDLGTTLPSSPLTGAGSCMLGGQYYVNGKTISDCEHNQPGNAAACVVSASVVPVQDWTCKNGGWIKNTQTISR